MLYAFACLSVMDVRAVYVHTYTCTIHTIDFNIDQSLRPNADSKEEQIIN